MRPPLCSAQHPTSGLLCHKPAGHDGQHLTYTKEGYEQVWLSITVPGRK